MKKEELIDKLTFYEGFLDSFVERGKYILKETDIQSLKILREYLIKSKNFIKGV